MSKMYKFKMFVGNVPDAVVKLNNQVTNVMEAVEGTVIKWNVSKEGFQSDLGEIKLGSSVSYTINLARNDVKTKNTYTKLYKDEDGRYVAEQTELTAAGSCLPPTEGKVGRKLSVTEGGFVSWEEVSSSEADISELKVRVSEHDTAISNLETATASLEDSVETLEATTATIEALDALSTVVEGKASQAALDSLTTEFNKDKKNLADNYLTSAETTNQIDAAVDASAANISIELNKRAMKATTLSGYGITDAYTKDEVDAKTSSFMNYKGQVNTTNDFPPDPAIGDVYNVKSTGANYCWNGTSWDKLSEDIDLTNLMTKAEAQAELELKANIDDVNAAMAFKANKSDVDSALALKANKSEIPEIPTNVSAFANDAGYLTQHQSLESLATKSALQAESERAVAAEALKANAADVEVALASKLTKSELIRADGSLYNKMTLQNSNETLLWNESSGGGSMYTNKVANVKSFVGVNEGTDSEVCVQIYSKYINDDAGKEQVANKGTRLNVNPKGMYYTKGKINGSFDAGEELAVKSDVDTETLRAQAAEAGLQGSIDLKVNKADILKNGAVYNKLGNNTDYSLLFNESDGGGAQYRNGSQNVLSYVGVNNEGPTGVCAQLYSKFIDSNKGTRLNINPNGMYYTNGKTNGSFSADDELATKGELNLKATLEDVNSLSDQLRVLNDRLSEMAKTNKETVAPVAGEPVALNDATKDYTIASDFNKTLDVIAKSVEIKDATITAAEKLPSPKGVAMLIEASEEVAMKNSTVACDLTGSSNIVEVRNCQYITFRDMTFTGRTYNTIMTGQRCPNQPIKSLTIENCEFKEFADHVNIWAANFADNAVVTINNCHFYDSDEQVLALSNETLAKNVTINMTNCVIDKCETGDEYEGFILCQDYNAPKTAEGFAERHMFKGMTINLSNVTVRGVKLTKENFQMGTGAAGQMLYVYGDKLYMYDPDVYPTVNVM